MSHAPTKFPQSHFRLLYVGGNRDTYLHLRDVLMASCQTRLRVIHAAKFDDAILRARRARYDLVVCEGDGAAPTPWLTSLRKASPQLPVMFLRECIDEEAIAEAVETGKWDFLNVDAPNGIAVNPAVRAAIESYSNDRHHDRAEATLRKFWRAVEQSTELIIITDRDGTMEYVNPAFELLTGYARMEVVGQNLRLLKSEEQSFELYQDMWQSVTSGNIFRGILIHKKKNGETFVAEKTITPLRDGQGRITHFVSCDRDITEKRRLEHQLQQAQKMDAIGRLAGGVAHDFNNLLMVIGAYAELMQDSLAARHPLRHNVAEILTASRRAADLTRQLLAFGRKQVQSLQMLDLNQVLRETTNMLSRLIGEDIDMEIVPGRGLGLIRADRIQIEQIVMNLAANARDAMPHGGKLTIETSRQVVDESYVQQRPIVPPGDYVVLSVSDSGQGIPARHQAHIFEPFYTTKKVGKGTGLGLATVYGIVKQSGGFIWLYSEPGMGATFRIYLPQLAAGKIAPQPMRPADLPVATGTETVLLVEDENAVRASTAEFLSLHGYKILEAANGREALIVANTFSGHIHAMVSDVVMPHMSGAQVAKELVLSRPDMKVLFVSGYAGKAVQRHGTIDVTRQFLQKPFSLRILASKLRDMIEEDSHVAHAAAASAG